jgi:two-component system, LytTR family, sensor kinase
MRRLSPRLLALLCATFALTLVEGTGNWLRRRAWNPDASWSFALIQDLPAWAGFAALVPGVLWVCRRWPLTHGRVARHLPAHALAMVLFTAIHIVGVGLIYHWFFHAGPQPLAWRLREQTFYYCAVEFLIYGAIVGVIHALFFHDEARAGELASARLTAGLAEARLDALRAQLEPHFLFNTLNAISTLALKRDHDGVVRTVGRLSELLRATLDTRWAREIPLVEELALLEPYLDIQKTRFGERVTVTTDIAPEALEALVPTMLLQPLVENALQHGIEAASGHGRVAIAARRVGERLELEVCDSGPGFGPALAGDSGRVGIGLANTERRLREMHGDAAGLTRGDAAGGGALLRVTLPWRTRARARGAA